MQANSGTDRQALLYGLCAVLLWSTVATAFKLALRELDVLQLVAYSVSCSALALLAVPGQRLTSSVSRIGNLIFLAPLASMVFIATVLRERIEPATLIGPGLTIPGVLLQQRQQPPAPV
jgi:drug/metabolite transporter (DMT)-like permease